MASTILSDEALGEYGTLTVTVRRGRRGLQGFDGAAGEEPAAATPNQSERSAPAPAVQTFASLSNTRSSFYGGNQEVGAGAGRCSRRGQPV